MQAFVAPCSPGPSVNVIHAQPASQTCLKRPAIPPSSSPSPPIIGAIGDAKVNELLLGCVQASSSVKETLCNTQTQKQTAVDIRFYDKSFVFPIYTSLTSFQRSVSNYVKTLPGTDIPWTSPTHRLLRERENNITGRDPIFDTNDVHCRQLTNPLDLKCDAMISTATVPGSPPELTESRSSKSSSCASDFSVENDNSAEILNFEDIGLDDDHNSNLEQGYRHGQPSVEAAGRKNSYHTPRPSLPSLHCQTKVKETGVPSRSAAVGPMKRGFTSPSSITLTHQSSRPRSTSPPKQLPRSSSFYSASQASSVQSPSPRSSLPPSRRGSWQPYRKTIKELEAEYHDSDDELPEDASLWNVPISPFHSTNASRRSSFRGSPDREPTIRNPRPIPLEHTQSTPALSPRVSSLPQSSHRQRLTPRSSSSNLSRSSPTSPRVPSHVRDGRAKSWNLAMSDLSAEARIISENLEYHVDMSKEKEQGSQKPSSNPRGSAPTLIQLPPIQRGPLDFMPISKEKEAVLSRTRPPWLPPKDPKEEQKHLREYQKMMAASIEAEKKKENKQKSVQSEKDLTRESLHRIWDFYVNPTTDVTVIDRRVHDLCWRGIPPKVRGKVWQRAVGNPLGLTDKTYTKALERAAAIKMKASQDLSQHERSIASWFTDIDRDAETAFPELGVFQRDGPMWQDLVNVCEAYTCYRSDIGYLYGLQLIAGLLLLQIPDPGETFIFMANCLSKPIPSAFHTSDIAGTQKVYNRVVSNLGVKFPRLHDYLFEPMERGGLGLTGQEVLEPMFRTLFSNGLDLDRLCRVWDIWIFEGDRSLIRTAVAVLGSLQSQIFDVDGDLYLKRRNVQEMLGWGPFNRSGKGSYWKLEILGSEEAFIDEIDAAGKLDYTGR